MRIEFVAIAKIIKTRGLQGETVAEILTDFPERFENLERVFAVFESREVSELEIEKFRFHQKRILLKFGGIDSPEAAENLRGAEICIPQDEAVELEDNEFFDWELEGCQVETIDGEKLGTVKELMRTGGTEILVVKGTEKEFLIPFAETICTEVDIENKLIRVDAPEGLLEF